MWIIVSREYNDDPVFRSMSPLTTYSSRRRTILVFYDPAAASQSSALDRPLRLRRALSRRADGATTDSGTGCASSSRSTIRKVIGINESDAWNHADGLTANEKERLLEALGAKYAARVKSAEMLAVGWLETKLPEELEAYRHAMKVAHMVIAEAFSNKVITPGKTTNEDVAWWMRQRVADMGLGNWFHPSVTIHRKGGIPPGTAADQRVIQRGDMLHTDFGLVYLGFSTDTQHNAYVLQSGRDRRARGTEGRAQGGEPASGHDDAVRDDRQDGQRRRWRRARAEAIAARPHAVDLLPPDRLPRPRRRSADRHDRLSARRARSRRLRVPSRHVALDRAQRAAPRSRVGQSGRACSRSKRTPR